MVNLYYIALRGKPISERALLVIWDYICHPTQVNVPRLNPSQTGRYWTCLPPRDRRVSWPWCWVYTRMVTITYSSTYQLWRVQAESNLRLRDRKFNVLTVTTKRLFYIVSKNRNPVRPIFYSISNIPGLLLTSWQQRIDLTQLLGGLKISKYN